MWIISIISSDAVRNSKLEAFVARAYNTWRTLTRHSNRCQREWMSGIKVDKPHKPIVFTSVWDTSSHEGCNHVWEKFKVNTTNEDLYIEEIAYILKSKLANKIYYFSFFSWLKIWDLRFRTLTACRSSNYNGHSLDTDVRRHKHVCKEILWSMSHCRYHVNQSSKCLRPQQIITLYFQSLVWKDEQTIGLTFISGAKQKYNAH